ncbi:MAG: glycoside hydrolase family 2 TIM barrel-domain containing protein [Gemmatimonadales bacterium]
MSTRCLPIVLIFGCILAGPAAAQEGSPSPRQRLLMDYGWKFSRGDPAGAEEAGFDDSGWRSLDLPHDWSIEGPYDQNAPTGGRGGYLPTGVGWYRRSFTLPAESRGRRVTIEFDGVYQNSDVWINGNHLGHRPYGYISFQYDLTPHLVDGENIVVVRADNSHQPNTRWYSGSGIYRHVWLTMTDPLHVGHWGTFVTTPDVDSASAQVAVRTRIVNDGTGERRGSLRSVILDASGIEVARSEVPFTLAAGEVAEPVRELTVETPERWSPGSPTLYTLRATVSDGAGRVVDETDTPFGIREIAFDADRGFLLNGERVKMRGVNLHHGGGPVGAAVPEAVWERRLILLKKMGVNAIRTAHNPPAPEFLDLCDRLGLLVMDEAFDEWTHGKVEWGYHKYFAEWGERDLADFMRRDRNHPSVVLWSLGNEIGEQHAPGGVAVLRRLVEIAQREDPTRPVTTGNDHIYADDGATTVEFLELLDVVGYNYVDRWHERRELYASQDRHAYPDWKMIGTESSPVRGTRGEYPVGDDPERVQPWYTVGMIRAEQLWKFVSLHDYFAGDFMWTGIDYLGESFWPRKNSTSGQLDLVGFPDDGYFFYQSRWTDEPMIHLFPHWNWPDREGQFIPVLAYTNCDAVELYLNDRFIGEKRLEFPRQGTSASWNNYERPQVFPTTADLHLSWDVPYEPGVLRAVGKRNGEVVATAEVRTAGPAAALRLSVDRSEIRSGIRDVAHVAVEVVDADGVVVPMSNDLVRFNVEGDAARLLAVGNGDPTDHSSYQAGERRAFHGLLLAMIQSTDETGVVRVTVHAEGLEPASIGLTVIPGERQPRLR